MICPLFLIRPLRLFCTQVLGKLGRFNRTNLGEVQRLQLNPTEGEAGPQLRFYLTEFRNHPIDIPIRCLVDAAIEILQV